MNEIELVRDLHVRFERVERAILGDTTVGHRGLVNRVEALEEADRDTSKEHADIDSRRAEGDKRAHERIDVVAKKIDRIVYVFAGAFIGGLDIPPKSGVYVDHDETGVTTTEAAEGNAQGVAVDVDDDTDNGVPGSPQDWFG